MIKKMMLVMSVLSGCTFITIECMDGSGAAQAAVRIDDLTKNIQRALQSPLDTNFELFIERILKPTLETINVDMIVGFNNGAQPLSLRQWVDQHISAMNNGRTLTDADKRGRAAKAHTRLLVIKALLPAPKTTAVKPDSKKPSSKATGTSENGTGGRAVFTFLKKKTTWIAGGVIAIAAGWFFWNKYAKNAKKTGPQAKTGSAK